jgi:hypothetical protein
MNKLNSPDEKKGKKEYCTVELFALENISKNLETS